MLNTQKHLVKNVTGIKATCVQTVDPSNLVLNSAVLVNASNDSLMFHVDRASLVSQELKQHINLNPIEGKFITFTLEPMNLDISGYVVKTYMLGKCIYGFDVNLSNESHYFKECLFDLLPGIKQMT